MTELDLLLADVTVVDGSGQRPFVGSVGVQGARVAWVGRGPAEPPAAVRAIAGEGRVLAPGFIDVHTHDDHLPFVDPTMAATLRQGVTTVVVGNCGASLWPPAGLEEFEEYLGEGVGRGWVSFAEYLAALEACRPAVNVASLVGHGSLRSQVMGDEQRPPSTVERAALRRLTAAAVDEGAFGLSTGLVYLPGMHASTDEIVDVAEAAAAPGAIYTSHVRGEGRLLFAAVAEAIDIGRRAGIPAHVSHLKLEGREMWGRTDELLALLEGGADVSADQYPYTAWMTYLSAFLPPWAPVSRLAELLASPSGRRRLASSVECGEEGWQASVEGSSWDDIVVASAADSSWVGRSVATLAGELGVSPVETVFRILLEKADAMVIGHAMSEEDVRTFLARPDIMVASDGLPVPDEPRFAQVVDHPRSYGTFPRVLGHYVREEGVLTLAAAVRKMSRLPAKRFGLRGRGEIRAGAFADLVLFDPAVVGHEADFARPRLAPRGIDLVVVNGRPAWDGDRVGARAGRVLRRGA